MLKRPARTHTQKGYRAASHQAVLYSTMICRIDTLTGLLLLDNGLWLSQSTTKAINGYLNDLDLPYRASRYNKAMYLRQVCTNERWLFADTGKLVVPLTGHDLMVMAHAQQKFPDFAGLPIDPKTINNASYHRPKTYTLTNY